MTRIFKQKGRCMRHGGNAAPTPATVVSLSTPDSTTDSSAKPESKPAPHPPPSFPTPPLPSSDNETSFAITYCKPTSATSSNPLLECRNAILNAATLHDHFVTLQHFAPKIYFETIQLLSSQNVAITPATKAKILATFWISRNTIGPLEDCTQSFDDLFFGKVAGFQVGIGEVLKLTSLLDKSRLGKQTKKKYERLPVTTRLRARQKHIKAAKELFAIDYSPIASLTSSLARRVRKWVGSYSADFWEFQALHFPTAPWKAVADLCHLNPNDFAAPWFLPFCFGTPAPEGTLVGTMASLTTENLVKYLEKFPFLVQCYSLLRQKVAQGELKLTERSKVWLVSQMGLDEVLWFYEELVCGCVEAEDALLAKLKRGGSRAVVCGVRIDAGEVSATPAAISTAPEEETRKKLNYPKLMERILYLRGLQSPKSTEIANILFAYAEKALSQITFPTSAKPPKVAIFGDCSASMEVAVSTATILASLLTARLEDSRLTFFHEEVVVPSIQPKNTADVLTLIDEISAQRCTSPAACLWEYYVKKEPVDLIIIVTDEGENSPCSGGFSFATAFGKYKAEVAPNCELFFISFLAVGDNGYMMKRLVDQGFGKPKQFRLDGTRPDLSKFDELLGLLRLLMIETQSRDQAAEELEVVKDKVEEMKLEEEEGVVVVDAGSDQEDFEWVE
ncbi:hypothetical protein HDV05_008185 [Chytridiales sp. JEL 0842]|nr:hypothetical protein HDV05_008185 [Chytridiales sp. JEL 0842]